MVDWRHAMQSRRGALSKRSSIRKLPQEWTKRAVWFCLSCLGCGVKQLIAARARAGDLCLAVKAAVLRQAPVSYINNTLSSINISSVTILRTIAANVGVLHQAGHRSLHIHDQRSLLAAGLVPRHPRACSRPQSDSEKRISLHHSPKQVHSICIAAYLLGFAQVRSGVRIAELLGRYPVARFCSDPLASPTRCP